MFLAAWEECTRIKLKYMVYDESILEHKHKKMLQSFEFCIVDVSLRRTFVNNNQFFKTSSRVIAVGLCVLSLNSIEARAEMEIMPADELVAETAASLDAPLEGIEKLTESHIRSFYKKSSDVQLEDGEKAVAFLEKHTHEDAKNKLRMKTMMAGKAPDKKTVITDKETLISDTKAAYEKGKVETVENEIVSFDIAEDGMSAIIVDKTLSDFTLTLSEKQELMIRSKQTCDALIVVQDGIIQTKNSECDVEVSVKPVE